MTAQSIKRQNDGWSQTEAWYKKALIGRRRVENMYELMIEEEMEKKQCKLLNDIYVRKSVLQKLGSERNFLPENCRDSSAMKLRRLAGQPTNVRTTQTT